MALAKRMKMGRMSSMHYSCSYAKKSTRMPLKVKIEEQASTSAGKRLMLLARPPTEDVVLMNPVRSSLDCIGPS